MSEELIIKEEKTFSGHTNSVTALAMVNSQTFISGSWDKTIKLWKIDMDTPLRIYTGHTEAVISLAVFPDKKQFISGSSDGTIKLWNIDSDTPERTYTGHTTSVWHLYVLDDNTFISRSELEVTITLWNKKVDTHSRKYYIGSMSVLAVLDDKTFISGSCNVNTIKLRNIDKTTPLQTYEGHTTALAVFPHKKQFIDKKQFISGSCYDNTIKQWNIYSDTPERTYQLGERILNLAILDDNRFISVNMERTIQLWDKSQTEALCRYDSDKSDVDALAVLDSQTFILARSEHLHDPNSAIKMYRYFEPALEPIITKKLDNEISEYPSLLVQSFRGTSDGYKNRFLFDKKPRGGKRRNKKSKKKRSNKKKYSKTRRKSRKI